MRRIAEKVLDLAEEGNMIAIKEIGDRLDGKAQQAIVGADGGAVILQIASLDERI